MTTTMPEASLVPAVGTDTELVLAVSGGGRSQQEVRLRSGRCSVGSGANCTLRLKARDVAPLHCWIVRGRERTLIRCCSPDTRLNGRSFEEAALAPGDVISCGPIELQVVELGGTFDAGMARVEADTELAQRLSDLMQEREGFETSRRDAELELSRQTEQAELRWQEIRQGEAELQRRSEALEARERELAQRSEALQRQIADFETECSTRATAETSDEEDPTTRWAEAEAELAAKWDQLRSAEQQHAERCQQFETQQQQAQAGRLAELQARESDLAEREVNMRRAVADLATAHEQLDAERQEFERQRQEQPLPFVSVIDESGTADLDGPRQQLAAGLEELEAKREELTSWEERLQHQEERIMQRRDELQAERERFYAECEQIAAQRATVVETAVESYEVENCTATVQEEEPEVEAPAVCRITPAGHAGEHDDEAAVIETYMSRLLGKSRAAAHVEPHAAPVPAPKPVEAPVEAVAPAPQMPARRERAERSAPAERTDLNTMRELANANARDAIGRSQEQAQFRAGMQRLIAAIAFTLLGVWLGYMSNLAGNWMYTLGCLSGGFGMVAAIAQGAWLARRHLQKGWESTRQFAQDKWASLQKKGEVGQPMRAANVETAPETANELTDATEPGPLTIEMVTAESLVECDALWAAAEVESVCCEADANDCQESTES